MPFAIAVAAITTLMLGGAAAHVASWRAPGAASTAAIAPGSARPVPDLATPAPIRDPGRLAIDFEHGLKDGRLRVWVDDALVLSEEFDGGVSRNVLGFARRKGRLGRDLEVSPGAHTVRVQVSWGDNRKTRVIAGSFRPGATRRLEARVGGLR